MTNNFSSRLPVDTATPLYLTPSNTSNLENGDFPGSRVECEPN